MKGIDDFGDADDFNAYAQGCQGGCVGIFRREIMQQCPACREWFCRDCRPRHTHDVN